MSDGEHNGAFLTETQLDYLTGTNSWDQDRERHIRYKIRDRAQRALGDYVAVQELNGEDTLRTFAPLLGETAPPQKEISTAISRYDIDPEKFESHPRGEMMFKGIIRLLTALVVTLGYWRFLELVVGGLQGGILRTYELIDATRAPDVDIKIDVTITENGETVYEESHHRSYQ